MPSTFPDHRLSDFSHRGLLRNRDPLARVTAAGATALVYCVLGLLALTPSTWLVPLNNLTPPSDAMVRLLPPPPPSHMEMKDFTVRLIKPVAENAPMPEIVIRLKSIPPPCR